MSIANPRSSRWAQDIVFEIFYASDQQREVALDTIEDVNASGLWPGPVVTEVSRAPIFRDAEPEHQDYLERIPNGYTHFQRTNWKLPKRSRDNNVSACINVFEPVK
jgi:peptide methionine sulfoxide reductase MsrA